MPKLGPGSVRRFIAAAHPDALMVVHRDRLAAIARTTPAAMAGYAINIGIAVCAFYRVGPRWELYSWAAVSLALSGYVGLRALRPRVQQSSLNTPLRSAWKICSFAMLLALPWVALTTQYAGHVDPITEVILISLAVGMAASGAMLLAPVPMAAITYVTTLLAPVAFKCLFVLGDRSYLFLGALAVSYWVFLLALIRTKGRVLVERDWAVAELREAVTALRRSRAETEEVAMTDGLTGLENRRSFFATLEMVAARIPASPYAVFFLDLDHFKAANDAFGHAFGDKLLHAAAGRIKSAVRPSDVVGRLGGDEFAIIACSVADRDCAEALARRIRLALSIPFNVDGTKISIGVSIGIALSVEGSESGQELLASADKAMYDAKKSGEGFYFHETDRVIPIRRQRGGI